MPSVVTGYFLPLNYCVKECPALGDASHQICTYVAMLIGVCARLWPKVRRLASLTTTHRPSSEAIKRHSFRCNYKIRAVGQNPLEQRRVLRFIIIYILLHIWRILKTEHCNLQICGSEALVNLCAL